MKPDWRYLKSFFIEELVETGDSSISPGLQVWYANGRNMLNTSSVNYSFGRLDTVFRSAFEQIHLPERNFQDILLLGLGAGNVTTILTEIAPEIKVVAVEIDPEVLRLGEAHFGLKPGPRLEIELADALEFVWRCELKFDMVVVDLFVDDAVPEAACSEAYLQRLAAMLRPGGMLLFNRLAYSPILSQHTEEFGRKMMAALPGAYVLDADLNKVWVYEKK